MIQQEEEGGNIAHSHVRTLPTGCISMLGWRQLSSHPIYAAVNVTQANIVWCSRSLEDMELCGAPDHSLDLHNDCVLLSLTT